MKNYRATFTDGNNNVKVYDFKATDEEKAWNIIYSKSEMKRRDLYTEVICEEVEDGIKQIGLEVIYKDTYMKKQFITYVYIEAETEEEAVKIYNKKYKGKHFWFNPNKLDETGKCVLGAVIRTYYI